MGLFDTLKFVGDCFNDFQQDAKEIMKKTSMDLISDYVEKFRNEGKSFDELLKQLYEAKASYGFYSYAALVILMTDYYFYDPYYMKKKRMELWGLKKEEQFKDHEYNLGKLEETLISKFRQDLLRFNEDDLSGIVHEYENAPVCEYSYDDSIFYYKSSMSTNRWINHYSCNAAIQILKEKYDIDIEIEDLSEYNEDDMREQRSKERWEKIGQVVSQTVESIASNSSIPILEEESSEGGNNTKVRVYCRNVNCNCSATFTYRVLTWEDEEVAAEKLRSKRCPKCNGVGFVRYKY